MSSGAAGGGSGAGAWEATRRDRVDGGTPSSAAAFAKLPVRELLAAGEAPHQPPGA